MEGSCPFPDSEEKDVSPFVRNPLGPSAFEGKGRAAHERGPRLISWNVTLRCPLRCAHCYIDAGDREAEGVLTTDEAFDVIDQIRAAGKPVVILSGGEPLMREDIFEIARYGTDRGLAMAMGSSGIFIDEQSAGDLRYAGIRKLAISIDSATAAVHDRFRGVPGAWASAVQGIEHCRNEGIGVQINTTVLGPDIHDIDAIVSLGKEHGVRDFQLFFPVPTGRGAGLPALTPQTYEDLIRGVLARYNDSGINIRPTCAPQFRRIADQLGIRNPGWGRGCIAGLSYCRIYATGEVTPCPYLPVSAGNVKTTPFADIWNHSTVFAALRDPGRLTGKCGKCGYQDVCGGCRARAYGARGGVTDSCGGLVQPEAADRSFCGEDPWCRYEPGAGGS